ncbi:hypothetical protein CKO_01803 [Citrobacter koseri ATCC BAA-895]|uniref:Uncharacterized protein n=1 Tax=Citrobacter koseri (strain ATCC BAA-895 / CDC 4225-83 / SGSC4696) TaxID=290338 RepID=A8AHG8_CITK8|nr:hypothetical protein CKO_01803 [Citrobacter koseri ATCC BAA-895]
MRWCIDGEDAMTGRGTWVRMPAQRCTQTAVPTGCRPDKMRQHRHPASVKP